jgi:hypothetical protein
MLGRLGCARESGGFFCSKARFRCLRRIGPRGRLAKGAAGTRPNRPEYWACSLIFDWAQTGGAVVAMNVPRRV